MLKHGVVTVHEKIFEQYKPKFFYVGRDWTTKGNWVEAGYGDCGYILPYAEVKSKEIAIGEEILINGLVGTLVEVDPIEAIELDTIYPKCVSKGKLMSGDKLYEAISSIEADIAKFNTDISGYTMAYVEIEEEVYRFHYDLEHYANAKDLKKEVEEAQFSLIDIHGLNAEVNLKDWCRDNRGAKGVKTRGIAWSTYLAHQGLIWDKRRPFCTTIHKAQGSEYDWVFIAQTDIKRAIRKGYYMNYAKLMYVALSRAINKVVIV